MPKIQKWEINWGGGKREKNKPKLRPKANVLLLVFLTQLVSYRL